MVKLEGDLMAVETEPSYDCVKEMTYIYAAGMDAFEIALNGMDTSTAALLADMNKSRWILGDKTNARRSVSFADPPVTHLWEVPRIDKKSRRSMFYSKRDIAKFKDDARTRFGKDGKYSRDFCEQLLENLDRLAAESVAKGDLKEALVAFNHALRVRTKTRVDFDPRTASTNIEFIADIYCLQNDWKRAHIAYLRALDALHNWADANEDVDASTTIKTLIRKLGFVQSKLAPSNPPSHIDI